MVKILEIINEEFIAPNECLAVIFADSKEELSSEYSVSGLPTGRTLAPGCKFKTADGSEGYLKSDGTIEWIVEPSDLPPVDSSDNGKVLVVEDGQWAVGESPVTPEDIQQAVDNYCEANFSEWAGGLDSGLTQPLMAAPADKVGELKSALSEITTQETEEEYVQLVEVTKYDDYLWSVYQGVMSYNKVAHTDRVAIEFDAKPNTDYIVQGFNAGVSANFAIGFFADDSTEFSMSIIDNAEQETIDGKARCTRFTTPAGCTFVRYTVYKNASYDMQLEKQSVTVYEVDADKIPDTIQRTTSQSLQTISKTVVGAINELYAGGGQQSDLPWVVKPDAESADMSSGIENALSTYGICQLVSGTYKIGTSGIEMPDNTTLIGFGASTVLLLGGTYDSTPGQCVIPGSGCVVANLTISGWTSQINLAETIVERHGILWTEKSNNTIPEKSIIENCYFKNFKGGAITCKNTGSDIDNCLLVSNCYMTYCRAAINVALLSEFNRFEGCHASLCYWGIINNGGNNTFVNIDVSRCRVGYCLDNEDGDKTNNAHGSVIGCTFNHMGGANPLNPIPEDADGIRIINSTNGVIFTGCQLFYSRVNLEDAAGIILDHCNFGQSEPINITGGGLVLLDGCTFGTAPTITVTDNTTTHLDNCYIRSSGVAVTL